MIGLTLMRGLTLTTGTTSSLALMLVADELEIDFDLNCSGGPSTVTYYIEYSEDLVTWFAEVAEEDAGKGVVLMPKALRTLADENSTTIANNPSFRASCQFKRRAPFARVQMSAAAGTVVVNSITAPYGLGPYGTNEVTAALPPPNPCTPGQVLFDGTFLTGGASYQIQSASPPDGHTTDVYVIDGIGSFPACSNFQIMITLDMQWNGFHDPPLFDNYVYAYLNDTGLNDGARSFSDSGAQPATLRNTCPPDNTFYTETLLGEDSGFSNPYSDFAGPLGPQSLYFWVPPLFPEFDSGIFTIKNIHVHIVTI